MFILKNMLKNMLKIMIKSKTYLTTGFIVVLFLSSAKAMDDTTCNTQTPWSKIKSTQLSNADQKNLVLELDESSISLGKPFSFRVKHCGDTKKPNRITADAIMPAHQHGMNYMPKIIHNEDSPYYDISGFLFHMPGLWEITVSSYQTDEVTHYTKVITIK